MLFQIPLMIGGPILPALQASFSTYQYSIPVYAGRCVGSGVDLTFSGAIIGVASDTAVRTNIPRGRQIPTRKICFAR